MKKKQKQGLWSMKKRQRQGWPPYWSPTVLELGPEGELGTGAAHINPLCSVYLRFVAIIVNFSGSIQKCPLC